MKRWLITLTFLFSCFSVAQDDDASSVAREWLEIVDAGGYFESYKLTSEAFKSELSEIQWNNALTNIRLPLGEVVSRSEFEQKKSERLPGRPDGEYITIRFNTKFEHATSAIETITMSKGSGGWVPLGYFIK